MRVLTAKPKAERLACRDSFEKLGEALERRPSRIALPSARLKIPRPPALARHADDIAGGFKLIRINLEFVRQETPQVPAFCEAVRILAGENRGTRRRAARRSAERVREQHALARDAVERGRLYRLIAVNAGMRINPVIRQAKEDIGTRVRLRIFRSTQNQRQRQHEDQ